MKKVILGIEKIKFKISLVENKQKKNLASTGVPVE